MGKHETGYPHAVDYLYPTKQSFVVDALAHHLRGARVLEPACGTGDMAAALRRHGCARVYTSDIVDRRRGQDETLDFLSDREPRFDGFGFIITNPPGGPRNRTAVRFIERGLEYVDRYGVALALLLPSDFDSAVTRRRLFADCPHFAATIVLTRRIVWFERRDGNRPAPKENHRWFIWRGDAMRDKRPPVHLYDPGTRAKDDDASLEVAT
jgi:hypothetical protein